MAELIRGSDEHVFQLRTLETQAQLGLDFVVNSAHRACAVVVDQAIGKIKVLQVLPIERLL